VPPSPPTRRLYLRLSTTVSSDFPVTTVRINFCYDGASGCNGAAFIAKLNPTGTAIEWATYLGDATGNTDAVNGAVAHPLDGNGNVYVTGSAEGSFPWVAIWSLTPLSGLRLGTGSDRLQAALLHGVWRRQWRRYEPWRLGVDPAATCMLQ